MRSPGVPISRPSEMARPNEARPPPSQSAEGGSDRICIARSAPRVYAGAKDRNARGTWSLGRRGFAGSSARTRRRTHAPRTSTDAHQWSMLYALCCGESHRFNKTSSLPPKSRECIFRTPGAGEATRRGRPPIPTPQRANSPSFLGTDGASESCQALGSFPTRACGEQGLPAGGRTVKSVSLR